MRETKMPALRVSGEAAATKTASTEQSNSTAAPDLTRAELERPAGASTVGSGATPEGASCATHGAPARGDSGATPARRGAARERARRPLRRCSFDVAAPSVRPGRGRRDAGRGAGTLRRDPLRDAEQALRSENRERAPCGAMAPATERRRMSAPERSTGTLARLQNEPPRTRGGRRGVALAAASTAPAASPPAPLMPRSCSRHAPALDRRRAERLESAGSFSPSGRHRAGSLLGRNLTLGEGA